MFNIRVGISKKFKIGDVVKVKNDVWSVEELRAHEAFNGSLPVLEGIIISKTFGNLFKIRGFISNNQDNLTASYREQDLDFYEADG